MRIVYLSHDILSWDQYYKPRLQMWGSTRSGVWVFLIIIIIRLDGSSPPYYIIWFCTWVTLICWEVRVSHIAYVHPLVCYHTYWGLPARGSWDHTSCRSLLMLWLLCVLDIGLFLNSYNSIILSSIPELHESDQPTNHL